MPYSAHPAACQWLGRVLELACPFATGAIANGFTRKGNHVSAVEPGFFQRHHFFLRRLHSLCGVVPVGVFLINHLLTNSLTPWPTAFDAEVGWIHSLPYLVFIEFGLIILPLAFHAAYGVAIALQGKSNVATYGYADNWRYTLQRVTGWIAAVFIVVHLLHFRLAWLIGNTSYPDLIHEQGLTAYNAAAHGFSSLMVVWMVVYAVGLTASVYHFANGLCTFCITWGITVGVRSRRYVSIGAACLGLILLTWGFMSLVGLSAGQKEYDETDARGHAAVVRPADAPELTVAAPARPR